MLFASKQASKQARSARKSLSSPTRLGQYMSPDVSPRTAGCPFSPVHPSVLASKQTSKQAHDDCGTPKQHVLRGSVGKQPDQNLLMKRVVVRLDVLLTILLVSPCSSLLARFLGELLSTCGFVVFSCAFRGCPGLCAFLVLFDPKTTSAATKPQMRPLNHRCGH